MRSDFLPVPLHERYAEDPLSSSRDFQFLFHNIYFGFLLHILMYMMCSIGIANLLYLIYVKD